VAFWQILVGATVLAAVLASRRSLGIVKPEHHQPARRVPEAKTVRGMGRNHRRHACAVPP